MSTVRGLDPWEIKELAASIIGEDRVPREILERLVLQGDDDMADFVRDADHMQIREEAERIVGEDRIATDELSDLIDSYGFDEDADVEAEFFA